jgi:hypothetical protein
MSSTKSDERTPGTTACIRVRRSSAASPRRESSSRRYHPHGRRSARHRLRPRSAHPAWSALFRGDAAAGWVVRPTAALSGAPFRANILAPAAGFRILTGTPRTYVKSGDSGAQRIHAFCEDCGSPIYSCAVNEPPHYSLRRGALNQRAQLGRPTSQIWVSAGYPGFRSLRVYRTPKANPDQDRIRLIAHILGGRPRPRLMS